VSSNLTLSANAFWRGLRAVACIRNLVLGPGFRVFRTRAAGLQGGCKPVEKTLEKPSKPLGFSKTVATSYQAPETPPEHRSKRRRGAQLGRPTSRLLRRIDADDDDLTAVDATRGSSRRATAPPIASLVREWLAELKVMGRSEQTIKWYRQKMEFYLEHEGGPATLDGLTSGEVKRLLGNLIDRHLAPNTIHGFFEVVRAFANWALREGFPVDPAVVRMRPPKVPETELETYNPTQQEVMLAAAAPGWPSLAVQILLGTGMRVGELAALTVEDYESDGDVGFLKVRKGKGAKFRRVPAATRSRSLRESPSGPGRDQRPAGQGRRPTGPDGDRRLSTEADQAAGWFQSPRPQVPPYLRHRVLKEWGRHRAPPPDPWPFQLCDGDALPPPGQGRSGQGL